MTNTAQYELIKKLRAWGENDLADRLIDVLIEHKLNSVTDEEVFRLEAAVCHPDDVGVIDLKTLIQLNDLNLNLPFDPLHDPFY